MINPINSLEVEVFSFQMQTFHCQDIPSEGIEGGLVGRIDEVASLTFRCNVLQSEGYLHFFSEILKVTLSAEQALCLCFTDSFLHEGVECECGRKAAVDLQSQEPNNRLLRIDNPLNTHALFDSLQLIYDLKDR